MTAPALSEFDRLVSGLMAVAPGITLDRARATIRLNYPNLAPTADADEKITNVLEREEQAYVSKLFRGFGCKVYNLSQARASKQTPGLSDMFVTHRAAKLAFWFEVKRASGGRLSNAQMDFGAECTAAGVLAYYGDRRMAAKLLVDVGLARVGDGPCGIVPFHEPR